MLHWLEVASNEAAGGEQTSPDGLNSTRSVLDRSGPLPVVVCGDFNTTPESLTCRTVAGHSLGFESLWDREVSDGQEEDLLSTFKFRSSGKAKRVIDYIWCVVFVVLVQSI